MLDIFKGIFDSSFTSVIPLENFLLCLGAAAICGIIIALCFSGGGNDSGSFSLTLTIIPAIVCVVIMLVNGNIGAGVAVAGAFSLVRFRSAPGTAREISAIFLAMSAGLISGMGYLAYSLLFTVLLCGFYLLYLFAASKLFKKADFGRTLRITIPENLDYTGVFSDIFCQYTKSCETVNVKTTDMGSLYKLTYDIVLKDANKEKEFIDTLRCRNGNLEISISMRENRICEL